MFSFFGNKRKAARQKHDAANISHGTNHAQSRLRNELVHAVTVNGLLDKPGLSIPSKWRNGFRALFAQDLSRGGLLRPDQAERVLVQLGAAGFTLDESQKLMLWRETSPEWLVGLLLGVLCGLSDEEAWAKAGAF